MHWAFDTHATRGLKVISEIPDLNPCLVEGRNGVGKTTAVQLLQLVFGHPPSEFDEHPDRWRSIRERLGPTSVTVSELAGGATIRVEYTPDRWADTLRDTLSQDGALARITLNGEAITIGDVRKHLSVDRISGNDDLSNSVEHNLDVLASQFRQLADCVREREVALSSAFGDLQSDLEQASVSTIGDLEAQLQVLKTSQKEAIEASATLAARHRTILSTKDLIYRRETLDDEVERLLQQRAAAAKRVEAAEAAFTEANDRADALAAAVGAKDASEQRLAKASKLLSDRERKQTRLAVQVIELAARNELSMDLRALLDREGVIDGELAEIEASLEALDSTGQVRSIIDAIYPPLAHTPARYSQAVLAEGFAPELTVAAAAQALEERRAHLARQPEPEEVRNLVGERQRLEAAREVITELRGKVSELARQGELVESARTDYEAETKLVDQTTKDAADARAAREAVGAAKKELQDAHAELAQLAAKVSARGALSPEDASRELQKLLEALGVAEAGLADAEVECRAELERADAKVRDLQDRESALTSRLAAAQAEIELLARRLSALPWFDAGEHGVQLMRGDGSVDHAIFARTRDAILGALTTVSTTRDLLERLQGLAMDFKRASQSGGRLSEAGQELRAPFSALLSRRILDALNSDAIRLFFNGTATAESLDPLTQTLTLRYPDGVASERPLGSFSTGERAFAFTQARILDTVTSGAPNRLLVLDEFGAYVSAERLPELARFLHSEEARAVASQIVVILPLQVDYKREVAETTGELHETYLRRSRADEEAGYFAEELLA